MKINTISDNINHVKGVVSFYKDGELIMVQNNMVVNDGKKFIQSMLKNMLLGTISVDYATTGDDSYSNYKLYKVYLGEAKQTNSITTLDMTLNDLGKGSDEEQHLFKNLYYTNTSDDAIVTMDFEYRRLRIVVEVSGLETTRVFSEVYITTAEYVDGAFTNNEALFSRVLLNNISVEPNSSYKMEYYLYF